MNMKTSTSKIVYGVGPSTASVMFLAEAPATQEVKQGKPLVGKTGQEFDYCYLPLTGLLRENVYLDNVYQYQIPADKSKKDALISTTFDTQKLDAIARIMEISPRVLVTLGAISANVIDENASLEVVHGIPHTIPPYHPLDSYLATWIPCYHPSYGIHSTSKMSLIMNDFDAIGKYIKGEIDVWKEDTGEVYYGVVDSKEEIDSILCNKQVVAVDTEQLSNGNLFSVQFSVQERFAYMIHGYKTELVAYLCHAIKDKLIVFHNAQYDIDKLKQYYDFISSNYIDTMNMSYVLQDQPQSLKVLGYRLCNTVMQEYREIVHNATQAKCLDYFEEVLRHGWDDPQPVKEWRNTPQYKYHYDESWVSCTKKHKESIQCFNCYGNGCEQCSGKGYMRLVQKRGKKYIVQGTENGYWNMKQPQNIVKTVQSAIKSYNKSLNKPHTAPVDLLSRWVNMNGREEVESILGSLKMADLGDLDFNTSLNYGCRDADITLRVSRILANMIINSGMEFNYDKWGVLL